MKKIILTIIAAASFGLLSFAQTDTIRISTLSTAHLLFDDELTYVDISNKAVAAKIIDSDKSILALKAREPFTYSTTISTLESSGEMHTFVVMYEESPDRLIFNYRSLNNQIKKEEPRPEKKTATSKDVPSKVKKRRLYHIADVEYGIAFSCLDVWMEKDATWFALSLENNSGIRYDCSEAMFVIENRKKAKRSLVYEKQIVPQNTPERLDAASGAKAFSLYGFDKLAITKDQVLKVYLYETGGSRNYILTFAPNDVNKASRR